VEIEKGMFRNKALLHHYPGKGTGFLWQLAGKEPHALTGLDFLPADTALAISRTWTCRCSGPLRKGSRPSQSTPGAGVAGETSRRI